MYTVIRFVAEASRLPTLMKIGADMNEISPGIYSGLRKAGDGFSCEISNSMKWKDHYLEILSFINDFSESIKKTIEVGGAVTIDIAIEPEDRANDRAYYAIHYDKKLLSALVDCGAELEVTIY